jgi:hypothetical protein
MKQAGRRERLLYTAFQGSRGFDRKRRGEGTLHTVRERFTWQTTLRFKRSVTVTASRRRSILSGAALVRFVVPIVIDA